MATEHDKAVLNSILDPSLPLGDVANFESPQDNICEIEPDEPSEPDSEEARRSAALEREAVRAAEAGRREEALRLLNEAVSLTPSRASPYNNRAQLHRLMHNTDVWCAPPEALSDAGRAVELSGGRGLAGRQALCQRAQLHQLAGRDQPALDDYRRAAQLGSQFAKTQLVALNPYAALCNRMLGEVMNKLKNGELDEPKV